MSSMSRLPRPVAQAGPPPARLARWQSQWLTLRQRRVQRAQTALQQATDVVNAAQQAVTERLDFIDRTRAEMNDLAQRWSEGQARSLPRWGGQVVAFREALAERLERAEYALIDDERALEEAQEQWQACHAALARAMAREAAVQSVVAEQCGEALRAAERRAVAELEDRVGPAQKRR